MANENKRYYWLKLFNDFFDQREIKKLRKLAGGDTYTIIYLRLQLLSLKIDGNIYFEATEDNIFEQLAIELDESIDDIKMTILYLQNNGLCEIQEQDISLIKTKELIGVTTASTIRSRKHREIKKQQKALQCNTDATKCNEDIDIEKELDIELEKEKTNTHTRVFTPPTLEEVELYCVERKNNVDSQRFIDFYTAKGWFIGKSKMKDWKACVRTWEKSNPVQKLDEVQPTNLVG